MQRKKSENKMKITINPTPKQALYILLLLLLLSHFSRVQLFATLWTVAHQALLSMGFSRQDYCSGLSCPPSVLLLLLLLSHVSRVRLCATP